MEAAPEEAALKKILVPLDGSKLGKAALPYAQEIAVRMDAELILFQVAIPSYAGVATPDQLAAFSQLGLSAEIGAREYLQGVEQRVRESWAKIQSVVGLGAGAAAQILEQA